MEEGRDDNCKKEGGIAREYVPVCTTAYFLSRVSEIESCLHWIMVRRTFLFLHFAPRIKTMSDVVTHGRAGPPKTTTRSLSLESNGENKSRSGGRSERRTRYYSVFRPTSLHSVSTVRPAVPHSSPAYLRGPILYAVSRISRS